MTARQKKVDRFRAIVMQLERELAAEEKAWLAEADYVVSNMEDDEEDLPAESTGG